MSMLAANTVISPGTDDASVEDWEFIRLQDKAPGDIPDEYDAELTRGDVIDIFASIFGRGSCGQADAPESYSGPEEGETPTESAINYMAEKYSGVAGAQQLAAEFGLGDFCNPETIDGGDIKKSVYLHASSDWIFNDYNIVSYDAQLSKYTVGEQDIYARIEFSNTSFSSLYYYIDQEKLGQYLRKPSAYGEIYEWRGSVIDEDGNRIENPSFTLINGRVYFPGNWSGILIIKRLPIKYHLYTLTISGTVDADATRHYDARVSAKANGLAAVHLDISEEVSAAATKEDCPWLDFELSQNATGTAAETTCGNCDEGDEEKKAAAPEPFKCDDPITAEEYSAECCGGPVVGCLPSCRRTEEIVQGPITGQEPDEYCGETNIITLMPAEGKPCGRLIKSWTTSGTCDECEGLQVLVWEPDNPEIIAPGGSITLEVTGGDPIAKPITWSLQGSGTGYTLTGGGSSYVNGRTLELFATLDVCGPITVKADDDCSNVSGIIQHTGGVEFTVEYLNLLPGNYLRVDIINGSPTYEWSVIGPLTIISGGGSTSTYAYVKLDAAACDGGSVEVTDACNSISLPVNNIKPPISFTAESINIFPGAWGRVYTSNGRAPYQWSVNGPLTIINGGTSATNYADVRLDAGACVGGSVDVTDICNSDSITVNNTVLPIYLTGTKTTLCTSETARCYAYDGQLPYVWSVTGGLVIIAGGLPTSTFCDVRNDGGGGNVQISDSCGLDTYTFNQTEGC